MIRHRYVRCHAITALKNVTRRPGCGRRCLLIWGAVGMTISCCIMALVGLAKDEGASGLWRFLQESSLFVARDHPKWTSYSFTLYIYMHILDYIYTMYLFWSIYLDINLKILSVKGNMLVSPADWNSFREFHSTFVYSHSYMLASHKWFWSELVLWQMMV